MNATARFYVGFTLVLALVIGVAYYAGYHAGAAHARPSAHLSRSAP